MRDVIVRLVEVADSAYRRSRIGKAERTIRAVGKLEKAVADGMVHYPERGDQSLTPTKGAAPKSF